MSLSTARMFAARWVTRGVVTLGLGLMLWASTCVYASEPLDPAVLAAHNQERLDLNATGMWVLGAWAVANLAGGSVGYAMSEGRWRSFHQMNAAWNIVNLGIATASLLGNMGVDPTGFSLAQTLDEDNFLIEFLLLNVGLDIGYVVTGAWLYDRGVQKSNDRLVGFGQALWVQGGFLLVFDTALYFLHRGHRATLLPLVAPLASRDHVSWGVQWVVSF